MSRAAARAAAPQFAWREFVRPWKLLTLSVGIALLVAGARSHYAPDWDVPVSFIMALLAYLTAPWSVRVLLERDWKLLPLALFAAWFTADGCYAIYWHFRDPQVLALMRAYNFPASLALYGLCGLAWLYRGTFAEFFADASALLSGVRR